MNSVRGLIVLTSVAILCAFVGCAEPGPVYHPVSGQLLLNGRPVAEATLVFHPVDTATSVQKPIATTDADGRFAVSTMRSGDGAPPGDYSITVELRAHQMIGEEMVRNGLSLLPAKYSNPKTSGIHYTVVEGENQMPPIELTDK